MRRNDDSPRVPIGGQAGFAICDALKALALHPGDGFIVVKKERLPQGGYRYFISNDHPPAAPALAKGA